MDFSNSRVQEIYEFTMSVDEKNPSIISILAEKTFSQIHH